MSIIKMNFNTEVAKLVGTDAAIIYSNIEYWVEHNRLNNKHFYDGNYWTYNSIEAFKKYFDYLTISQIKTCISKLEKHNLIEIGNYNKLGYDRTKWYSIPIKSTIGDFSQMDLLNMANGFAESSQPIPYYKTDIKLEKEHKKEIFFSDSIWNNYETLKNELKENKDFVQNYAGVNLKHYIEDVLLWSDSKNQKRTNKGWLATLRNWMKRDKTSNKLVLLENFNQNKGGFTNH